MEITLRHTYRWHATTETYRWHDYNSQICIDHKIPGLNGINKTELWILETVSFNLQFLVKK